MPRHRQHKVKLSNGRTLVVEEQVLDPDARGGSTIGICAWDDAHGDVDAYICALTVDGVLVMCNSNGAGEHLLEGLQPPTEDEDDSVKRPVILLQIGHGIQGALRSLLRTVVQSSYPYIDVVGTAELDADSWLITTGQDTTPEQFHKEMEILLQRLQQQWAVTVIGAEWFLLVKE